MEIKDYILLAKSGEQKAFKKLLDKYWSEVYGFILKRTENETDAEDVTIETFAKAFDKIHSFNPEFQFNTWLIAIAKNVHIDHIRKRKSNLFVEFDEQDNHQAFQIIDESLSKEDEIILEQNLAQLLRFIKMLKPHYQEIIQLRYFQELSYQEIADHLGDQLNNVKIKLLRAKKLLYELIKESNSQ